MKRFKLYAFYVVTMPIAISYWALDYIVGRLIEVENKLK